MSKAGVTLSRWSQPTSSSFLLCNTGSAPALLALIMVACWSTPCTIAAAETQCVSFSDTIDGINKDRAVERLRTGLLQMALLQMMILRRTTGDFR
jgi:hypothetical protein